MTDKSSAKNNTDEHISISEWERLIRSEEFDECPICGGEFEIVMGCRKICSCGYMEGCED